MSMTDFKCCLCGAVAHFPTIGKAAGSGWDWFKGYAPKRMEFCPNCRTTRKFHELYRDSRNPGKHWEVL